MERTYYAVNLDLEMHWHCEGNDHIWSSYLSENFVMRCFGIVRTIPTSSSSWPMDHILDLMVCFFIVPEMTLIISMRATLFWHDFDLHCGLAITVVERLQRYNCIWLTYIDNVEQNILFYIEIKNCEMLSLCGKLIWRKNFVFWLYFVSRRRLYRHLVNHFVLEKLISVWLVSWLFTFGWEPVWSENFWKCFDDFEFIWWNWVL